MAYFGIDKTQELKKQELLLEDFLKKNIQPNNLREVKSPEEIKNNSHLWIINGREYRIIPNIKVNTSDPNETRIQYPVAYSKNLLETSKSTFLHIPSKNSNTIISKKDFLENKIYQVLNN